MSFHVKFCSRLTFSEVCTIIRSIVRSFIRSFVRSSLSVDPIGQPYRLAMMLGPSVLGAFFFLIGQPYRSTLSVTQLRCVGPFFFPIGPSAKISSVSENLGHWRKSRPLAKDLTFLTGSKSGAVKDLSTPTEHYISAARSENLTRAGLPSLPGPAPRHRPGRASS